ncbi:bifunctional acetate--CoA ligase family protein/GNAT family N-acetyltransferase [Variovorax brevis]|uniref:bifunctional acetate--CoA ligase family protein/GNAT family N-acetyltransferase n=1 Tax=Variovorax brevis TaxID=3053503 RepID=UPI0033659365
MSIRHLDQLLSPASVAIFGASERPGSVGATVWRNVRAGRFTGAIYPVNPKHAQVAGVRTFAKAADLPAPPDLAILCTPAHTITHLVVELGALGTRAVLIVTAGLDARQKQATLDAARPGLVRLLGPNCIGLLSPHIGLNASFAQADALAGEVAFVSQSGALATATLDWAKGRGIGLSHLVSLGDHCDVDFGDLLDYLASDAKTRAILLYIESIQSPRKFMSAARAAARNKPVIVVKAGRAGNGVGVNTQGQQETLGVGRAVSDPDGVEAEFALLVRSDLKGQGLGKLLLNQLIEHARSRGIERLVGNVLRENTRMLKLSRSAGFEDDRSEAAASDQRRVVLSLNGG